jgi:putative sigma-54 modulation protein
MKITIQSLHFTASEHLKAYIQRKCEKLDRFFDRIVDGSVLLKVRNELPESSKEVEILLNVPGQTLVAQVQGRSFEEATDLATDKIKEQLRRHKEKLRENQNL